MTRLPPLEKTLLRQPVKYSTVHEKTEPSYCFSVFVLFSCKLLYSHLRLQFVPFLFVQGCLRQNPRRNLNVRLSLIARKSPDLLVKRPGQENRA